MSTAAPATGAQAPSARTTTIVRFSGVPACVVPSDGSLRMSERLSFSSTKYGPSVLDGVSTQDVAAAWATSSIPIDSSSRSGPLTRDNSKAAPAPAARPTAWRHVTVLVSCCWSVVVMGRSS
jgi:hypothetical protein